MSLPTLLTVPTNKYAAAAFSFDHAMAHRGSLGAMAPLDRFSVIPYHIDPQVKTGGWLMNHQQAHGDFRTFLPVIWGWWQVGTQEYGIASANNLMDVNLTNQDQLRWWTWANSMDHYIADNVLPLELQLTFPFW